jgi:molybdate transport system ATP-binding protein
MMDRLAMSLHAVSVRRGGTWVLRDISWRLRPGERWALLGDNGAGKTQLLKLLSGDVWPTPAGPAAPNGAGRHYRVSRQPVELIDAKRRVAYVGAELQDKYARYGWNLPVRDLVATGLHRADLLLLPVTPQQAKRVTAALRLCGLQGVAARKFLSLSYGQKRLALLARALVQDPDWLLLDEFYNGLDADYRRRIDAVLDAAVRRGQSWVATAHRAADVPRGTRRLLELAAGRVQAVKPIRSSDLARLRERAGESPRHRGKSVRDGKPPRGMRAGKASHAVDVAATEAPMLLKLSRVNLYVDYRPVLRDLDWQLRRGEHWAVYGANGAGKSSFLKLLYGDLSPSLGGRIERAGFPKGTPIAEWKRSIGYVSPELQSDYAVNVSVFDLVASGRYASIGLVDEATAADRRAAAHWLRFFGLLSVAKRRPRELSYGQLRRALIARALAADARILLLDEPLTGLDPAQRAIMKRLLERLMKQLTLIIAVHHAEDLPRGMTHGLRLHNRRAYPVDSYSAT